MRSVAPRSRLRAVDVWWLAGHGMRGRPLRAALSAAGIALGVATMVAVLGISSSSRSQLIAEIDSLGTNLLTVTPGQSFTGQPVSLPPQASAMVRRIGPVLAAASIGDAGVNVYRSDRVSPANTNGIAVYTAETTLLSTLQAQMASGRFLDTATTRLPVVVLGSAAAAALGVDRADGSVAVWLGGRWFAVVGILRPVVLAPELDLSALIGFPMAEGAFDAAPSAIEIYVRVDPSRVAAVQSVLAATAEPAAPQDLVVADPADALTARADASAAFESLFLALGAIGLLVGGVGIANVMVIAVLERRGEIGLRRALGATRRHVAAQFVAEPAVLGFVGGVAGALLGGLSTIVYAFARHWQAVVPLPALGAAVTSAVLIATLAGVYPALRAAHLSPAEALRST